MNISFSQVFLFWLKIGFLSFGGPAGQIALMHKELVEERRWISEKRFLHALNFCMVLPGPEAQQLATYIGWLMHKTWGGIVAGVLFLLPSLFILIGLSWVYMAYGNLPLVAAVFYGIKPAVTAIVLHAAYRIGTRALNNKVLWGVAAVSFIAIFLGKVPFPLIVLLAATFGFLGSRGFFSRIGVLPAHFELGGGHKASKAASESSAKNAVTAIIDDNTPTPAHAQFKVSRLLVVCFAGAALWCLPMAALWLGLGWAHTYTQMAWFFTKAALLTFGGAYAVLPYVYQGAVDTFGWTTPRQMIDGLALGETTPGPLIMIVAFVAFVGGWGSTDVQSLFAGAGSVTSGNITSGNAIFLGAAVAAFIVTWFTFLPSFIFILAGGPLVETTHNTPALTAPLSAITAAVVGVIVNLALFFAYHSLVPKGIDWIAVGIFIAAAIALFALKRSVLQVIFAAAVAGIGLNLAGLI